jgi:hypothetical protein
MAYKLMDPSGALDMIPKENTSEDLSHDTLQSSSLSRELSLSDLTAHCVREIAKFRRGEPYTKRYGFELVRRAIMQRDQEAWTWMQYCFGGIVHDWVRRHPQRAVAYHLENEENYVEQAFERFWQATTYNQLVEFRSLAAALQYLRASVNGAILDTLRANQRPEEVSLPESGAAGEPSVEDETCSSELWDILNGLYTNSHERRLAYLLFYCGLKPREIVHYCSPEWSSVQEIYVLSRTMMERVSSKVDFLRWRLS